MTFLYNYQEIIKKLYLKFVSEREIPFNHPSLQYYKKEVVTKWIEGKKLRE